LARGLRGTACPPHVPPKNEKKFTIKMDSFKAEFKSLFDKLTKHTETLEESNRVLRDALKSLLNEDDIKELPAYTLIKMTYSPYLDESGTAVASVVKEKQVQKDIYDPLHAPPSSRYGSKKSSASSASSASSTVDIKRPLAMATPVHVSPVKTEESTHYSSQMPDMNSCLLSLSSNSVKPAVKQVVKQSPAANDIKPKSTETVYRVEIQGKNYLRYNDFLYDETTKMRAGKLSDFKLGTTTDPQELSPIKDFPNYYLGQESVAYILINGDVAQAVGTYENGDLALWE